jgi:hypothetical protein
VYGLQNYLKRGREMPEDYIEQPDPRDEDDPEYQKELFATMSAMGVNPADMVDKEYAAKYSEFLAAENN